MGKIDFGICPCIVPFNKKIHDNLGKIGKTVDLILEVPDIRDSVFSAHHLPEFKGFKEVGFGLFYKKNNYLLKDKANEDTNKGMKPFFVTSLRRLLVPKEENLFMKKNTTILEYRSLLSQGQKKPRLFMTFMVKMNLLI